MFDNRQDPFPGPAAVLDGSSAKISGRKCRQWIARGVVALSSVGLVLLTGCQAPAKVSSAPPAADAAMAPAAASAEPVPAQQPRDTLVIQAGDVLKISFPGAPNLDSSQQVRQDGKITLAMVGEVMAAGLTPVNLEKDLLARYSSQLVTKEVVVAVVSSSYAVYVSGAVLRPGKYTSEHALTALEAIMEAGGFDSMKANSKEVMVIRREDGKTKNYTLNLKAFLEGKPEETFYLKTSDIVFVPEKFVWF